MTNFQTTGVAPIEPGWVLVDSYAGAAGHVDMCDIYPVIAWLTQRDFDSRVANRVVAGCPVGNTVQENELGTLYHNLTLWLEASQNPRKRVTMPLSAFNSAVDL